MDMDSVVNAGISGFWVSTTLGMLFEKKGFASVVSRGNLERSAKIGVSGLIYDKVFRGFTSQALGRMGANAK